MKAITHRHRYQAGQCQFALKSVCSETGKEHGHHKKARCRGISPNRTAVSAGYAPLIHESKFGSPSRRTTHTLFFVSTCSRISFLRHLEWLSLSISRQITFYSYCDEYRFISNIHLGNITCDVLHAGIVANLLRHKFSKNTRHHFWRPVRQLSSASSHQIWWHRFHCSDQFLHKCVINRRMVEDKEKDSFTSSGSASFHSLPYLGCEEYLSVTFDYNL